jgi:thermostable 8-oxoguanine DNA glycosylase
MMEKVDLIPADDAVFVPREVIEAFKDIYDGMKEAQRMLRNVGAGFTPAQIRDTEITDKNIQSTIII